MEIGMNSFRSAITGSRMLGGGDAIEQLFERIRQSFQFGLSINRTGEFHKKYFFDLAPSVVLVTASGRIKAPLNKHIYCLQEHQSIITHKLNYINKNVSNG